MVRVKEKTEERQASKAQQTDERKKALEVKSEVLENFSDAEVKMIYQPPNFKIRLGEFRTRIEAQKLYSEVLKKFPLAFIVPDKIDIAKE